MSQLQKALALCKEAHKGQFRSDGVTPYETHPIAVAELVSTKGEKIVALLHDVLEDSDITFGRLDDEFGSDIAWAVLILTRRKIDTYKEYISIVRNNILSRAVKIADMFHNLTCNPTERQKKKYFDAMKILKGDE